MMQAPAHLDLPLHEYLRQHAREQPDHVAYLWYGRAITYAELDRASDAFAARLAELGVQKGDPVALFMSNCPQYIMAHFGILPAIAFNQNAAKFDDILGLVAV